MAFFGYVCKRCGKSHVVPELYYHKGVVICVRCNTPLDGAAWPLDFSELPDDSTCKTCPVYPIECDRCVTSD